MYEPINPTNTPIINKQAETNKTNGIGARSVNTPNTFPPVLWKI